MPVVFTFHGSHSESSVISSNQYIVLKHNIIAEAI